ncbi:MAG: VWA domain-containing protein [Pirellulaceae bacterium]|nr:VWA domain-containing protein [Pirellulaceae bacterium]
MSWVPTMEHWWQWSLLAAVPVGIILLYFLKLRREPVEVPSTYLWSRTVEDLHVNSLLQRLRRNLLLLLQLLAVLLAILALLRPGHRGELSGQGRSVFLLDTSASMLATDVKADGNRFDEAKRLIEERINVMSDSDQAMLVTFDDRPDVLQAFTSDRRRLRDALARATVTNRTTDILGALKAADGLANPRRSSEAGDVNDIQVADEMPADLLLFSDGGFQPVTEFNLGNLVPEYISIGSASPTNLAITAFSAERNVEKPSEVQAFATVVNFGSESVSSNASLFVADALIDASNVQLKAGEETGVSFTFDSEEAVTMRMELDLKDDLPLDNTAYAGLTPMKTVSVLVITPGNTPLELGLTTEKAEKICIRDARSPSYLETEEYQKRADAGVDDLIIYDRCSPKTMPKTNTFFIGSLPVDGWSWATEPGQVVLIDIDRTHPMMRYLELYSLLIFSGRAIEGPAGTTELVGADVGPMLSIAPRDGYQDLVLGFEIISQDTDGTLQTNTNWYAERSWPVFVLNLLRYLAGAAEASGAPSYRPGETVRVRVESALDEVSIGRVDATPKIVRPGPSGIIEIVDTDTTGNYRVEADGKLADLFSVNLFDHSESDLKVAAAIELGYESIESATRGVETRREYWRLLLIVMLVLLVTEWWLYSKRVA